MNFKLKFSILYLVFSFFVVKGAELAQKKEEVPQLPRDMQLEVFKYTLASSKTIPELRKNVETFLRVSEKKEKQANVQLAKTLFEQRKKEILEEIQEKYDKWAESIKDEYKYNIVRDGVNAQFKTGELKGETVLCNVILGIEKPDEQGRRIIYKRGAPRVDNTLESYELAQLLIANGADVNMGKGGKSMLVLLMNLKDLRFAELLIKNGAYIDQQDYNFNGYTPLWYSVFLAKPEMAQYLLEHGANPLIKDAHGTTMLQYIEKEKREGGLFAYGDTSGHERWVERIDQIVPLLQTKIKEWEQVLSPVKQQYDILARKYNDDCKLDMFQGVNQQSRKTGNTPLICVLQHIERHIAQDARFYPGVINKDKWAKSYELITLLLKHGADVNRANKQGITALMLAAERGIVPVVELLLKQRGIKVNAQDEHGRTALRFAVGTLPQITSLLLKHGADSRPDNHGQTPLAAAHWLKEAAHTSDEKANIEQVIQLLEKEPRYTQLQ